LQRIIKRRQKLHELYASHSGLVDASRLAHLNGTCHHISVEELHGLWESTPVSIGGIPSVNHVYVHVPFCKSICSFCNYERLRPSSADELQCYVENIIHQITSISKSVQHLTFSSIYFGGGTPSVLSPKMLDQIMGTLDESLVFHPNNGRHFEFDPAVMNAKKFQVLKKYGFTRLSFGVQSLDTQVNKNHNRGPQSRQILKKRFVELKESQFDDVACDILLGLAGTTPQQMLNEISEILREHQPYRIDIFMITPTKEYIESHFSSNIQNFWNHQQKFEKEVLPHIPEIVNLYNYQLITGIGHRMTLKRKKQPLRTRQTRSYTPLSHQQGSPVNVLAFGPSARGSIFNVLQYQNMRDGNHWHTEGFYLQSFDEARIHLCYELRDRNNVDHKKFHQLHNMSFSQRFPLAHYVWSKEGIWNDEQQNIKEQSRLERTKSLMWLVEEEKIEDEVARHLQFDLSKKGIQKLIYPLQIESALEQNIVILRIDSKQITLRHKEGECRFRIAPGWSQRDAIRCIALDNIPEQDKERVKKAIALVRKMSLRNRRNMAL
jgi:coproporphyrinogen III oxidase-like Fe-S oxidoreductase